MEHQTLSEQGTEVIALMSEMVKNENYAALYNLSNVYAETVNRVREGDYATPSAVYELTVSKDHLPGVSVDPSDFSDDLYAYVVSAATVSFASQINQKGGDSSLAVSSMFAASMSFVNETVKEDTLYLYVFENGCPVMVSFLMGEDSSFRATGYFIINDAFQTDSAESIQASCKELGIEGVKVQKQQ